MVERKLHWKRYNKSFICAIACSVYTSIRANKNCVSLVQTIKFNWIQLHSQHYTIYRKMNIKMLFILHTVYCVGIIKLFDRAHFLYGSCKMVFLCWSTMRSSFFVPFFLLCHLPLHIFFYCSVFGSFSIFFWTSFMDKSNYFQRISHK